MHMEIIYFAGQRAAGRSIRDQEHGLSGALKYCLGMHLPTNNRGLSSDLRQWVSGHTA